MRYRSIKKILPGIISFLLFTLFVNCSSPGEKATEYAYKGDMDSLKSVVEANKNPDLRNDYGWTALMSAAESGNLVAVRYLLDKKASPNLRNENGDTALIRASVTGKLDVFKYIVEKGGSVYLKNHKGYSPLMKASERGHIEIIKFLISRGIDVNEPMIPGKDSTTALHLAAKEGMTDVMKILVIAGANVNSLDARGFSPLMCAIESKKTDAINYMLNQGPNLGIRSYYGDTAKTLLEEYPNPKIDGSSF